MRDALQLNTVVQQNLVDVDSSYWLSTFIKNVNVGNQLDMSTLVVSQNEIRVFEFDIFGLVIKLNFRVFYNFESL
jgi:hypothetical protein